MNNVFNIETGAITGQENGTTQIYELPCPNMGDRTFAYRESDTRSPFNHDILDRLHEQRCLRRVLTMSGTTTDFETLKELARTAADKIQ